MLPKYRDVAMVFQSYALYPHLTVARQYRLSPEDPQACRRPNASAGSTRSPAASSSTACSTAAAGAFRRPAPAGGAGPGDHTHAAGLPDGRAAVQSRRQAARADARRAEAPAARARRSTTIYVTHDQIEAMTLAHRVAVMNKGVIEQLGTPERDLQRPAHALRCRLHRLAADEFDTRRGQRRRPSPAPAALSVKGLGNATISRAVMGVRPEDVTVLLDGTGERNLTAPSIPPSSRAKIRLSACGSATIC